MAFRDPFLKVRQEALRKVFWVCSSAEQTSHPEFHQKMITAVTMLLRDTQASIRWHAIRAIKHMSQHGNRRGADAVLLALKDQHAQVREAGLSPYLPD